MNHSTRVTRAKVLFVDDEPAILEGVRQTLRRHPYEILTANSVPEALKLLEHTTVQVVVSDERMPGMQGSEFLAMVCRMYPDTMRIILSGQATLEAAVRAVNEGEIFRFLLKPCHPTDLAQTIQAALEFGELRRQTSRLLAETRQRGQLLKELERSHPGITGFDRREDGAFEIDADAPPDLSSLLAEIDSELEARGATEPDELRELPIELDEDPEDERKAS